MAKVFVFMGGPWKAHLDLEGACDTVQRPLPRQCQASQGKANMGKEARNKGPRDAEEFFGTPRPLESSVTKKVVGPNKNG